MRVVFLILASCLWAAAETELPLWQGDMPGERAAEAERVLPAKGDKVLRVTNVSEPTLTFFPAARAKSPNPVVIVCPGGAYNQLSFNKEGTEVAAWLNSIGVSAAVLKYRVPNNRDGALADARRAVRRVRGNSEEWNIDPQRVGMLGFSAGGHLAAACSNSADRPDFTILVYPAYLFEDGGIKLKEEIRVDENTPPAFVVQTRDDKKYYRSSLAYAVALDAQGVQVELHLFAKGGHGYGLRPSSHPVSEWPTLCEQWLSEIGIQHREDKQ